ncbi:hypothetical protein PIB30_089416 [Stylosanthes scabra]|uniref:Uncharacterized protein n=1 Tax=Stylosanthes scabra TaxID=79078 RepID=A0ABU6QUL8_9FABA|nr:hypothetical protein [Stylosanthes scabra]
MPYPSPHLKIARSFVQRGEVRPLIVCRRDGILIAIRASRWSKLEVVREVFLVLLDPGWGPSCDLPLDLACDESFDSQHSDKSIGSQVVPQKSGLSFPREKGN